MSSVRASTKGDVRSSVREATSHAITIRHQLHRHPELGYQEHRTSELIRDELAEMGVSFEAGLAGGTGVLAHLPATTDPGSAPTIALRADLDALPITEESDKEYASQSPGLMHACGHDGHTAILLATARALSRQEHRPNNVTFIFQPAEEGGAGADRMCLDGALDGSRLGGPVDQIYGLHGWPELEVGRVATRTGALLAATDEFDITIKGHGGHAAYPHHCVDPVVVAAHVTTALQTIVARTVAPHDSVVVTVGRIEGGHTYNVIPETCHLSGTVRSISPETRQKAEDRLHEVARGVSSALGASAEITWHRGYPVTYNDAGATERFRRIAREALGEEHVIERAYTSMGGEDFSYYAQRIPASFFFLGLRPAGRESCPGLHTPRFDFNDEAIPVGIELFMRLALTPM